MDKLLEAIRAWCRFNRRDITGEEFAHKFRAIFEEETTKIWDKEAWYATDEDRKRFEKERLAKESP